MLGPDAGGCLVPLPLFPVHGGVKFTAGGAT